MVYVKKYTSKKSKAALNPKKDSITLEEAKERFNEYYNTRSPTKRGRIRSKLGDIRYNKTDPTKVLEPNKPGSAKYLLPEGPRTFDMVGVDYFPEGTEHVNFEDPEYGIIKVNLKGIPKLKTGDTYSSHFEKKYTDRKLNRSDIGNFEEGQNLVNYYWDEHYKPSVDEGKPIKRPRRALKDWDFKRKGDHITNSYFLLGKNEIFFEYGGNIYYLDANMRVYDINHKFINKLQNMEQNIINELLLQGYITLTRTGYPKWSDNIYDWTIFYKYNKPDGTEVNIKLNMDDMIVRDVYTNVQLGDWSTYLNKNNLDYRKIYPYDMKRSTLKTTPVTSLVKQVSPKIAAVIEPSLEQTEFISEPEQIILDDTIKSSVIQPEPEILGKTTTEKEPELLTETIIEKEPEILGETTTEKEPELLVETTTEKEPELLVETTTEKEPELLTETIIEKEPEILAETTTEKEPEILVETTIEKEPELLSETIIEKEQGELSEPISETNIGLEEPIKDVEEEYDIIGDIDEMDETDEKIDALGFKLVNYNGREYYLQKSINKLIPKDVMDDLQLTLDYNNIYSVLEDINISALPDDLLEYEDIPSEPSIKLHETITEIVNDLNVDKNNENIITVTNEQLTDAIDNALQNTENYSPELVQNVVDELKAENQETINVSPEILTNTIETDITDDITNIINELDNNRSPVIAVDKDTIKSTLTENNVTIDDLDALLMELDEENTDDIPINTETIKRVVDEVADEKEELPEQKMETIDIIPSLENYRSKEFKNLLVNVQPQTINATASNKLKDITKYIYDSFHNNPVQDDEVFPNVVETPKMKYVDNEKFKKEMNLLVKNIKKYKDDYNPDTIEIIKKQSVGNNNILILMKNNQEVGDKITISKPKYNLLISRMNKNMDEQTKDKIIWSLYYRYMNILPNVPSEYKDKCRRISEDNVPLQYKSIFNDLEKYFGSTGMC